MTCEEMRRCGTRYYDTLYLKGLFDNPIGCDRLYMPITNCPTCEGTLNFSRSLTKINPLHWFGKHADENVTCSCKESCKVCNPPEDAFLIWIGWQYYTPENYIQEAKDQGISKALGNVPITKVEGKTCYIAMTDLITDQNIFWTPKKGLIKNSGVIGSFTISGIDYIINEKKKTSIPETELEYLKQNQVTPVFLHDDESHKRKKKKTSYLEQMIEQNKHELKTREKEELTKKLELEKKKHFFSAPHIPLTAFIVDPEPKIEVIQAPTSHIKTEPSLLDHWYDMKGNKCPRCQSTESIDIPEYPTLVCKSCWENRCRSCSSVTSINLDGTCTNCQIVNTVG